MHTTNNQMSWRNAIMFGTILTLASWSQAAVIHVPTGYATIQAAINAASPGDTVNVAAGIYTEAVTINKSLTLNGAKAGVDARTRDTGSGESILDGTGLYTEGAIQIANGVSNVIINGFEIRNYPNDWAGRGCGIIAYYYGKDTGASNITIQNNYMHDLGWNAVLVGSESSLVQAGLIVQRNKIAGCPYAGIELTNVKDSRVKDNKIIAPSVLAEDPGDAGVGIEIAARARLGVTISAGSDVLVEGNEITGAFPAGTPNQPSCDSRAGINILSRTYSGTSHATLSGVIVKENTVSGCTNVRAGVLAVVESRSSGPAVITDLMITNNVFDGNRDGIQIQDYVKIGAGPATHDGITIADNQIFNSTESGIHLAGETAASGIAVKCNSISGNLQYGVNNAGIDILNATSNWWGSGSGPSGAGPGTGDAVSSNVLFYPWIKADQANLVFIPTIPQTYNTTNTLSVSGGSGTGAVIYTVISGPGQIVNGNGLWVTSGVGTVTLTATKAADAQYNAASATAAVACAKANQTITFPPIVDQDMTNRLTLSATASSGLTVTNFAVVFGPAIISGLSNVTFTGTGLVSIAASQEGDQNWNVAANEINTFTVRQSTGQLAINVIPDTGNWRLSVPAGYTGPRAGQGDLNLVSVPTGKYSISYDSMGGYEVPSSQTNFVTAGNTSLFVGVYLEISTNIPQPRNVSATEGIYTNKIRILWQEVAGALGYEVWRSQTNDPATAGRIDDIPATSSFAGNKNVSGLSASAVQIAPSAWKSDSTYIYDDYGVVPINAYYYWVRTKTATQISPMNYTGMGYASLSPEQAQGTVDIAVSDLVFLPVNLTNGSHAGTVSCRLQNIGPDILSDAGVEFNFYMGSNDSAFAWIGSAQSNMTLSAAGEKLIILTPLAKRGLTVRGDLSGVQQVKVTVRHLSALNDPNLANNTTNGPGMVRVKASGANSPGRAANDYDGDGKSDFCLYQSTLGRWYAKLSGDRYGADPSIGDVGIGWTPVAGDYDGDGLTDVAAYERLSGHWLVLLSSNGLVAGCYLGGQKFTAAQCDFDGDAKTDPVVYRETDGYWEGAASSRQYVLCSTYLGETGYQSVVADYDGDGLADPAVYNRTTGLWGLALSGNGYQAVTGGFGGLGYLPVSADYDGDGRVDFGLYEYATGWWYVLMSNRSTGPIGQSYREASGQLGVPYGMPVVADYDGDGLADPAVYHQDTGLWELFLSSRGYQKFSGGFGGPDYQPVRE